MTVVRIAACTALLLLAAGCANTNVSVRSLTRSQLDDPARGVIVVSTGAAARCAMTAMWAPIYDAKTHQLAPGRPVVPVDEPSASDYVDHFGTLSALSLAPGRYVIALEYANPEFDSNTVPAFAFEVVAGQTAYLGELYRETPCGMRASVEKRDSFDRDMALALRLNPALAGRQPTKTLMVTVRHPVNP